MGGALPPPNPPAGGAASPLDPPRFLWPNTHAVNLERAFPNTIVFDGTYHYCHYAYYLLIAASLTMIATMPATSCLKGFKGGFRGLKGKSKALKGAFKGLKKASTANKIPLPFKPSLKPPF